MPTLEECSDQIGRLVDKKGFNADMLFFKLVWAQIELSEALDIVKKYGLPDVKIDDKGYWKSVPWHLGEEIVDTVFYCCDAYRLLKRKYPELLTMDEMFERKMGKNMARPKRYGQKWATSFLKAAVDHFAEEGILDEMMTNMLSYAHEKNFTPPTGSTFMNCGLCNGRGYTINQSDVNTGSAVVKQACWGCGGSGKIFKGVGSLY